MHTYLNMLLSCMYLRAPPDPMQAPASWYRHAHGQRPRSMEALPVHAAHVAKTRPTLHIVHAPIYMACQHIVGWCGDPHADLRGDEGPLNCRHNSAAATTSDTNPSGDHAMLHAPILCDLHANCHCLCTPHAQMCTSCM